MTEQATAIEASIQGEAAQPFPVLVFADFVCPYSFLAVEQIDRLAREYQVEPQWWPHWLHPETPPEGLPREPSDNAARRERLTAWIREMAPDQFPRIRFPEKRHYSFLAFEALEFARAQGQEFAYKTAVYDLMWTQGMDIGRPETLLAAAKQVGLDQAALGAALEEHRFAPRALAAVKAAREYGIHNTPTIILGRTRINGWHYYEVLESVMEKQGAPRREAVAQ